MSVTILTKNNEVYLPQVLECLREFDEVLLYDTGSEDRSLDIAKAFPNVSCIKGDKNPFELGFGPLHSFVSSLCRNDWIVSIDADECMSKELCREILYGPLDERSVYAFSRRNHYKGRHIKGCGWSPDYQNRIYHRSYSGWNRKKVHESVEGQRYQRLKGYVDHYSYSSFNELLRKQSAYADLFAKENQGHSCSHTAALGHGAWSFMKNYLLKRGFLEGKDGLLICLVMAFFVYVRYAKLSE